MQYDIGSSHLRHHLFVTWQRKDEAASEDNEARAEIQCSLGMLSITRSVSDLTCTFAKMHALGKVFEQFAIVCGTTRDKLMFQFDGETLTGLA